MLMMRARPRRSFTPESKAQTVELIRTNSKSVGDVCRDLELTETAVRRCIALAEIDDRVAAHVRQRRVAAGAYMLVRGPIARCGPVRPHVSASAASFRSRGSIPGNAAAWGRMAE